MYKAVSNIKHNGELYEAGQTITAINDSEVEALIEAGAIEKVEELEKPEKAPKKSSVKAKIAKVIKKKK